MYFRSRYVFWAFLGANILFAFYVYSSAMPGPDAGKFEEAIDGDQVRDSELVGQCQFSKTSTKAFLDYTDRHGYTPKNGGRQRIMDGEWPWGDAPFSGTLDCPEALLELPWEKGTALNSDGVVKCQPGQKLLHVGVSFVGDKETACPDSGKFQLEFGEGLIAEKGIRLRPHVSQSAIDRSQAYWSKAAHKKPPNVLLVMVDAVSRQSFERSFKRTWESVQRIAVKEKEKYKTNLFTYKRQHSVGGSSIRNLAPMLAGVLLPDLESWMKSTGRNYDGWVYETFREMGFVSIDIHNGCVKPTVPWPEYNRNNYDLHWPQFYWNDWLYDSTWIDRVTCSRKKKGAQYSYLKGRMDKCARWPGESECSASSEIINMSRVACGSGRSRLSMNVEYYLDLRAAYADVPTFTLLHDFDTHISDLIAVWRYDVDLEAMINSMANDGVFSDTVVAFMSDHGNQGTFVETQSGNSEYKQPFFHLFVPDKFLSEMSREEQDALAANQEVLTGPFDIHATLLHLGAWPNKPPPPPEKDLKPFGVPLTTRMPFDRSCSDAMIPDIECECSQVKLAPVPEENLPFVEALVSHLLTELTKTFDTEICRPLKLESIQDAFYRRVKGRDQVERDQYSANVVVESGRSVPMVMHLEMYGPLDANLDKLSESSLETVIQTSTFADWIEPCREKTEAKHINPHLCDCL